MTQKRNDRSRFGPLITLGMVGGGFGGSPDASNDLGGIVNNQVQPSGQSNVESFAKVQNVPSGLFSYGVARLGLHPWRS